MTHSRLLILAAWALASACSGGGETREAGSSAAEAPAELTRSGEPVRGQSESFSEGTVPMKISGTVARFSYQTEGKGECASSTDASIYEVPATLWHATYQDETASLNLTIWRPKAGGSDMVGFELSSGMIPHRLSTVKGAELVGSGTPGVQVVGSGGTLSVKGVDDQGHPIEFSIQCARFDEVVAEGG